MMTRNFNAIKADPEAIAEYLYDRLTVAWQLEH